MRSLGFIALTLAACGGAASVDTLDAGASTDLLPPYPAPFPTPVQGVNAGGPVLVAPTIIPIFFANDGDAATIASLTDFLSKLGSSSYWTRVTAEYGVGPATAAPVVMLTEAAPATITDKQIQLWLDGKIKAQDPAFPAPDSNTIYALHYPAGTSIVTPATAQYPMTTSCVDFGAYHSDISVRTPDEVHVSYAVLPRCTAFFSGLDAIENLTAAESHELVEASTDPYPTMLPAWSQVDEAHLYWEILLGGGELADLCVGRPDPFDEFPGLDYVVSRVWSNAAITAGHDPCVPTVTPGEVFFSAVPELPDSISYYGEMALGVTVPPGTTKTIPLDLFSDGPTAGPWSVSVSDIVGGSANFTFALDRSTGRNGDRLMLSITTLPTSKTTNGSFFVTSTLGAESNFWIGLISETP